MHIYIYIYIYIYIFVCVCVCVCVIYASCCRSLFWTPTLMKYCSSHGILWIRSTMWQNIKKTTQKNRCWLMGTLLFSTWVVAIICWKFSSNNSSYFLVPITLLLWDASKNCNGFCCYFQEKNNNKKNFFLFCIKDIWGERFCWHLFCKQAPDRILLVMKINMFISSYSCHDYQKIFASDSSFSLDIFFDK